MFSFANLYVYFCYSELNKLQMCSLSRKEDKLVRSSVLTNSFNHVNKDGLICEFGVHKGNTLSIISNAFPDKTIYGFDSFEGFPADGRSDWQQDFKTPPPPVNKNCSLVCGYFDETLPKWISAHNEFISFLHIDCDIYSSAKTIFDNFIQANMVDEGTIIVFDELINYPTWIWNEMLALYRFLFQSNLSIKWISCHDGVENIDKTLHYLTNNNYPKFNAKEGSKKYLRLDGKYYRWQASLKLLKEQIDYSYLENDIVFNKIKYMTKLLYKLTKNMNMNQFTEKDFDEIYELKNGKIRHIEQTCEIPFMKKAISMPFPETFFKNFLTECKFEPKSIIEIGGGEKFNFQNAFQCNYLNFDFSENTGIKNTIIKDIVYDNFEDYREYADVIYCNNTFEHIIDPYLAAKNLITMLKLNGYLFVRAPFSYRYHPVPNDYWRFTPSGLMTLFSDLECIEFGLDNHARRRNHIGSFKNKLDEVPVDKFGGWMEIWFSYYIGKKIKNM